jgi:hypothetical protein
MKVTRGVLVRDFLIFCLKLGLDAVKDGLLVFLSVGSLAVDLLQKHDDRRNFYRVMEFGERIDLWLNLYGAAGAAGDTEDGLFGASRAGSDTLLGQLEQLIRGGGEPRKP